MENLLRDTHGRWVAGVSGNPAGRPVGAKDTYRRVRCESERTWDCRANLGLYATSGPGRPVGSKNRSDQDRRKDAEEQAGPVFPAEPVHDFIETPDPAWPAAELPAVADYGTFYEDLSPHGEWFESGDYGYIWRPTVVELVRSPFSIV